MKAIYSNTFILLFFLCVIGAIGCSSNLTKVSGKVTLDGEPVEGASLTFTLKDNPSVIGTGITNSKGEYSLVSFQGGDKAIRGVSPGLYLISIVKKEEDGPPLKDTSTMSIEERVNYDMSRTGGGMTKKKFIYHIPKKYEVAENSGLSLEVPAKGSVENDFLLESDN